MQIYVERLTGETFTLKVEPIDTNAIVKSRILFQEGNLAIILEKRCTL